ncbi:MAG: hypothetical protein IKR75_02155 [Fibrobacter sp.]|nr:hypothetical protein [Fibrobacter sp.]MBR6317210.1 hypothetical protein [Fibrobacter sp.]
MVRGNSEWKSQQRREELPKAHCYRCGRERPVNEMVEVGLDVYACPGGCRKAENTEETK